LFRSINRFVVEAGKAGAAQNLSAEVRADGAVGIGNRKAGGLRGDGIDAADGSNQLAVDANGIARRLGKIAGGHRGRLEEMADGTGRRFVARTKAIHGADDLESERAPRAARRSRTSLATP